jgi:hypothetical protein
MNLGTNLCYKLIGSQGNGAVGNCSDLTGNQTHGLPACSIVSRLWSKSHGRFFFVRFEVFTAVTTKNVVFVSSLLNCINCYRKVTFPISYLLPKITKNQDIIHRPVFYLNHDVSETGF